MCLETITTKLKVTNEIGIGWKVLACYRWIGGEKEFWGFPFFSNSKKLNVYDGFFAPPRSAPLRNGTIGYEYLKRKIPLKRWMKAYAHNITAYASGSAYVNCEPYKSGFHIFTQKKDAEKWAKGVNGGKVFKVKYRKATCRGI